MLSFRQYIVSQWAAVQQRNSFAQNFFVTFSGSMGLTALGFLLTPVMTRLYPPDAYGQFAVFGSLISNLAVLMTLSYQGAVPLPAAKADALALLQLVGVLVLAATLLLALLLGIGSNVLIHWLHLETLGDWVYLLPVLLLLFNLSSLLSTWYTRTKEFRTRTGVEVAATLTGRLATLAAGWLTHGHPAGLVLGDGLSRLTMFAGLLRGSIRRELPLLWRTFSWARLRAVAYDYRAFPLYTMPSTYLGMLSTQLPIFFLTSSFGPAVVGLYSFSAALLEIPVTLIGTALAPIFYQKAAELRHTAPSQLGPVTLSLYNKLLYTGLVPLGVLTIFGDWIFRLVFGPRWEMAGLFTSYLGYYYIFKLTSQATSSLYTVLDCQRYLLITNILLLLARAAALALGAHLHDAELALRLFGLGSLVCSFLTDLHILYLLRLPVLRIALRTSALLLITLGVLKGLRYTIEYFLPGI